MSGGFYGPAMFGVFFLSGVVSLWLSFHQRTGRGLLLLAGLIVLTLLVASLRLITGKSSIAVSAGSGIFAGPFLLHLAFPEISALNGDGPYAVVWLVGTVGILIFTLVYWVFERSVSGTRVSNQSSPKPVLSKDG